MARNQILIGGPGSRLPFAVESFLCWSLSISCLSVSGYHYCVSTFFVPLVTRIKNALSSAKKYGSNAIAATTSSDSSLPSSSHLDGLHTKCWIPLTTHTKREMDRYTPMQRYHQLITMLEFNGLKLCDNGEIANENQKGNLNQQESTNTVMILKQRERLIQILRHDHICRRLASLAMRPYTIKQDKESNGQSVGLNHPTSKLGTRPTSLLDHDLYLPLAHELSAIWPRLLELPTTSNVTTEQDGDDNRNVAFFQVSVIIPAYGESGEMLEKQLRLTLSNSKDPKTVEVIVVDAGGGSRSDDSENDFEKVIENFVPSKKDNLAEDNDSRFGDVRVLKYTNGGGRGPCLNYGAEAARGGILTFFHLDVIPPKNWDEKICNALKFDGITKSDAPDKIKNRANSCAFYIGIDTSPEGLATSFSPGSKTYYPPGIQGVATGINIRTRLFSLPYGDQAISIHKHVFNFLGGFPDQCLMEDYDFVALLRKRGTFVRNHQNGYREELKIIPGPPMVCSPRRWQKYGVLYVTCVNQKLVSRYSKGLDPDQLYKLYYDRDAPKRESELSPWEVEMEGYLQSKK